MASWQEMPFEAKVIVNGARDREKPLGLPRGFEAAHLALWLRR